MGLQRGSSLLALVLLLASIYGAAADKHIVNDTECGCFMTNASNPTFFSKHRFYDFRSLTQHVVDPPALLNDPAAAAAAPATSSFFNTKPFADDWAIMSWNNSASVGNQATYLFVHSPSNIYIERNSDPGASSSDTYLTMRTARLGGFQSTAELQSMAANYRFVSVRMLARTLGDPGACTALFTYRGDEHVERVQEADIEILTKDPKTYIQYTNQPSFTSDGNSVEGASLNVTAPVPWTEWAVHRLDWSPNQSTWFVNGVQVAALGYQVPRDGSHVALNAWSNGGVWTGSMEVGKQAHMQIKWLEMVFNSTSDYETGNSYSKLVRDTGTTTSLTGAAVKGLSSDGKRCKTVCSIDESDERGLAVVLSSSGSSPFRKTALQSGDGVESTVWIPLLMTLLAIASSLPFVVV
ncbi:hypothetical protein MAPG_08317 [Magnaporthiopsis poae ATCC 64411]|uniref:GH16 domain-containing protein n=1 Tax=Magnaporthiopsis poae (strain ATCC 64411 / 73-15) TaxID=644358 RepID=A0A0C4E717_MAGP6|nr:hypothetical protein MAPG_08317 [Magnaporthiopsis poae ATCC 64411]